MSGGPREQTPGIECARGTKTTDDARRAQAASRAGAQRPWGINQLSKPDTRDGLGHVVGRRREYVRNGSSIDTRCQRAIDHDLGRPECQSGHPLRRITMNRRRRGLTWGHRLGSAKALAACFSADHFDRLLAAARRDLDGLAAGGGRTIRGHRAAHTNHVQPHRLKRKGQDKREACEHACTCIVGRTRQTVNSGAVRTIQSALRHPKTRFSSLRCGPARHEQHPASRRQRQTRLGPFARLRIESPVTGL